MADFLPLLVNGHFLPRALAPVPPPPQAQVQVCTSTSSLICLQGIWVLLGFFQPCPLTQEDEVSLQASRPPAHGAVSPWAAAWAPSFLSGWEPLRVRSGRTPGPNEGSVRVGTGKYLHFHRLQAASLSLWLTSPDAEDPLPRPQI